MIVLLCAYCPVRKVAREGQQSGNDAKLLVKVAPERATSSFRFAITRIDSVVWSSLMTTTMFGRVCFAFPRFFFASTPAVVTSALDSTSPASRPATPSLARLDPPPPPIGDIATAAETYSEPTSCGAASPAGWENYMRDLAEVAQSEPLTPEVIGRVASRYDFESLQ